MKLCYPTVLLPLIRNNYRNLCCNVHLIRICWKKASLKKLSCSPCLGFVSFWEMPRVITKNQRGTMYLSGYMGLRNYSIKLIDLNKLSLKSDSQLPKKIVSMKAL